MSRVTEAQVFSFLLAISVALAPIRLAGQETLKLSVVFMLPSIAYFLITRMQASARYLTSPSNLLVLATIFLLLLGFLLGNDIYANDDSRVLSLPNLVVIPALYLAAYIVGERPSARSAFALGLIASVGVQVLGLALAPPDISFKGYARSSGLFEDPNIVLLHLIPVFFLAMSVRVSAGKGWVAGLLLYPLVLFGTVLTLSRAGALTLLVCSIAAGVLGVLRLRNKRFVVRAGLLKTLSLGSLMALGGGIVAFDRIGRQMDLFEARIAERVAEAGLVGDRAQIYRIIVDLELADLLAPFGPGYQEVIAGVGVLPHNTFVDVFVIAGPVAFFLFAVTYVGLLRKAASRLRASWSEENQSWTFGFLFLALLSQVLLLSSLSVLTWKIHWALLGFANGMLMQRSVQFDGGRCGVRARRVALR